jgi:hypothetical protein
MIFDKLRKIAVQWHKAGLPLTGAAATVKKHASLLAFKNRGKSG